MPDLSVDLAGIRLRNPVVTASGTFGYGSEYADLVPLSQLGALVGLLIVWVALQFIPGAAIRAVSG